jgi:hypothetical protein
MNIKVIIDANKKVGQAPSIAVSYLFGEESLRAQVDIVSSVAAAT